MDNCRIDRLDLMVISRLCKVQKLLLLLFMLSCSAISLLFHHSKHSVIRLQLRCLITTILTSDLLTLPLANFALCCDIRMVLTSSKFVLHPCLCLFIIAVVALVNKFRRHEYEESSKPAVELSNNRTDQTTDLTNL